MTKKPLFSIIVCTRNRPELVKHCILSLKNQSFKDFEVIISDNSDPKNQEITYKFIENLNFKRLRYIRPPQTLSMHENYNFGIEEARGEYVGVLTDKNFFKKNALKDLQGFLKKTPVDIINYSHGGCLWFPQALLKWFSVDSSTRSDFEFYNPKKELLRRLSFKTSIINEGVNYNFGKIFFGFYHCSLVESIKKTYGCVFHPLSPDYNSTALALNLAKKGVFYHKKIMISVNNYMGTGASGSIIPGATLNFIKGAVDDSKAALSNLPIPSVYVLHNLLAYDYLALNRLGRGKRHSVNLKNLSQLVCEDLRVFPFSSSEEKSELYKNFNKFLKKESINLGEDFNVFFKEGNMVPLPPPGSSFFKNILEKVGFFNTLFRYYSFRIGFKRMLD
jgi:glycosyltransferase involved in cell wall biosynthesis